jgi:hypothetical protein
MAMAPSQDAGAFETAFRDPRHLSDLAVRSRHTTALARTFSALLEADANLKIAGY